MKHNEYTDLLKEYKEMFELFDVAHFNSTNTQKIYNSCVDLREEQVIPITHSAIKDNRTERHFDADTLHLKFIGPSTAYKGFPILRKVVEELYNEGAKIHLEIWGAAGESSDTLSFCGKFSAEQLPEIFSNDALLVVPSICNETFGFVVLEALSYGIPVMTSATVGAKDLVLTYNPWFVFEDESDLKNKLSELAKNRNSLLDYNTAILRGEWNHSIEEHCKEIIKLYKQCQK